MVSLSKRTFLKNLAITIPSLFVPITPSFFKPSESISKEEAASDLDVALFSDNGKEVSGSGYERQAVSLSSSDKGMFTNAETITFPEAAGDWGLVNGCALVEKETNRAIAANKLIHSHCVCAGDIVPFYKGQLTITL